jgi:hypothetical protein
MERPTMPTQHEVSGGASKKSARSSKNTIRVATRLRIRDERGTLIPLSEESVNMRLLIRRAEAARVIGVSVGTLDMWIRRRLIPCIRMPPRVVLLRPEDVLKSMRPFTIEARD